MLNKFWYILCCVLFVAFMVGCKTEQPAKSEEERDRTEVQNMKIKIIVGEEIVSAVLEENNTVAELAELLEHGEIVMPAYNYGGFEKVCSLGESLTTNDVQTTTSCGDIMLYSGNQIVIFYGPNSWAYTRLGKVVDEDLSKLEAMLSGEETEVTIELE